MTWDDLTAEERMLTDVGNVEAVMPESVGEFMRVWTALFLDETRDLAAAMRRADRAAAVAVVAELARTPGV